MAIKKMDRSEHDFIVHMDKQMYAKWEKYWTTGNILLALACILDPRQKIRVIEYYLKMMFPEQVKPFVSNLRVVLHELYKEYLEVDTSNSAGASSQSARPSVRYLA